MRVFGDNIGIIVGDSGSLASGSIATGSALPGINFIYFDGEFSSSLSTGSIGSIEATIESASTSGVRGELLFKVKNFADTTKTGSAILRLFHTGSNDEPRIGVGFDDSENIEKTFEIKSKKDSAEGTELILEGSRTTVGAQVGDSAGKVQFVINSSSFDNQFNSGSIVEIDSEVTAVDATGAQGHLLIGASKSSRAAPTPFWRFGYGADPSVPGNLGAVTTGSLNIKRASNLIDEQITLTHTDDSYIGLQYITASVTSDSETTLHNFNFDSTGHNGVIYDYSLFGGGNQGRTGQIMAIMSTGQVEMTDVSTPNIGSGDIPVFSATVSGGDTFNLRITNGNGSIFKAFVKKL